MYALFSIFAKVSTCKNGVHDSEFDQFLAKHCLPAKLPQLQLKIWFLNMYAEEPSKDIYFVWSSLRPSYRNSNPSIGTKFKSSMDA